VELAEFVAPLLSSFDRTSIFRSGFAASASPTERLDTLIGRGYSEEEIKIQLVEQVCLSPEKVSLDYWACYPVVFGEDPEGSIPDYQLFPKRREHAFLLLTAAHLSEMLKALDLLRQKLTVMPDTSVAVLRHWRERCSNDPTMMTAYLFDRN
jgi:hypothetical protein